eukprot:5643508-Amphidinium_carterae.1
MQDMGIHPPFRDEREVDGHIWELDGRANAFPIDHGVTNENFLLRTAEIIRTDFMEKAAAWLRLTMPEKLSSNQPVTSTPVGC